MSKTLIESNIVEIENSRENVFSFLSDFNNFEKLMPPQVTKWQSTNDTCSFVINGMATIGMKMVGKTPPEKIAIESAGDKIPLQFNLDVHLKDTGSGKCQGQLIFSSDMNPMMKMMVEKPLTNFFNLLAEKMKEIK